jgi:hypothetical protein
MVQAAVYATRLDPLARPFRRVQQLQVGIVKSVMKLS